MSPHSLSPFRLERWFVEYEFVPGSVFGPAYEKFIRVGLGGDTHQFQEGMSIMLDELFRWRERSHMAG